MAQLTSPGPDSLSQLHPLAKPSRASHARASPSFPPPQTHSPLKSPPSFAPLQPRSSLSPRTPSFLCASRVRNQQLRVVGAWRRRNQHERVRQRRGPSPWRSSRRRSEGGVSPARSGGGSQVTAASAMSSSLSSSCHFPLFPLLL